ncbi:MAG: type III pantothenate kinase [Vampirovibrionales bacterium]
MYGWLDNGNTCLKLSLIEAPWPKEGLSLHWSGYWVQPPPDTTQHRASALLAPRCWQQRWPWPNAPLSNAEQHAFLRPKLEAWLQQLLAFHSATTGSSCPLHVGLLGSNPRWQAALDETLSQLAVTYPACHWHPIHHDLLERVGCVQPSYAQPTSMGLDRRLNMEALATIMRATNTPQATVLSLGTACTLDTVRYHTPTATFEHLGGCIAPGWASVARSLQASAPHLPEPRLVTPPPLNHAPPPPLGRETQTCMDVGHTLLFWLGVRGLLHRYTEAGQGLWVCGGDAPTLLEHFPPNPSAWPNYAWWGVESFTE